MAPTADTLAIESARFGRVEIDPATVIEFPDGLIGLRGNRFALLTDESFGPLLWLHCIDDPTLSLPVADPQRFFSGFGVQLTDEDGERLGLDAETAVDVYVTVVAGAQLADFTANQRAPILVWDGRGHQVLNQAPGCDLRAPLFAEVMAAAGGD
ncbi:MAG: flagellar assembly protein FliW [Solirubrobacteraceae bacterium]